MDRASPCPPVLEFSVCAVWKGARSCERGQYSPTGFEFLNVAHFTDAGTTIDAASRAFSRVVRRCGIFPFLFFFDIVVQPEQPHLGFFNLKEYFLSLGLLGISKSETVLATA